jgi:hypothetical protein
MKIPSEKLRERLNELVEKPSGMLREAEELEMVLRRRLTKKEFKLFAAEIEGAPPEEIMRRLRLDRERFRELKADIRRKCNRDRIKRELYHPTSGEAE